MENGTGKSDRTKCAAAWVILASQFAHLARPSSKLDGYFIPKDFSHVA
jgi:hypothetical protein